MQPGTTGFITCFGKRFRMSVLIAESRCITTVRTIAPIIYLKAHIRGLQKILRTVIYCAIPSAVIQCGVTKNQSIL